MIFDIANCKSDKIGNKAKNLVELKNKNYNIPNGIILDTDVYDEVLAFNNKTEDVNDKIASLLLGNIEETSEELKYMFDRMILPTKLLDEILDSLDDTKLYAVRSSCINEDLNSVSFAGQYDTYLNVKKEFIETRILDCYASMFNVNALCYMYENGISGNMKMAVIIQEMVPAEYSGVVFTINPLSGNDKEMVIEWTEGLCNNIVDGRKTTNVCKYNWWSDRVQQSKPEFPPNILTDVVNQCVDIQLVFGMPYDIEFSYCDGTVYILQARPITKILYNGISGVWTTANFKDTISATVSKPFMWSMYEYAFNSSLKDFIIKTKMLREEELQNDLCKMFYGYGYWDISTVKKALKKIPGIKESDIDKSYGIISDKITNDKSKFDIKNVDVIFSLLQILKKFNENNDAKIASLLIQAEKFEDFINHNIQVEKVWQALTKDVFLKSETSYFQRIYINTVVINALREVLLHYMSDYEYNTLISNIKTPHTGIVDAEWKISRTIRKSDKDMSIWQQSTEIIENKILNHELDYMEDFKINYGYRSEKDLDVTYPSYNEDIKPVINEIKNLIQMEDREDKGSFEEKLKHYQKEVKLKKKLQDRMPLPQYLAIIKTIDEIKKMLTTREKFRDMSTHYYYLVRMYTLKYAKLLKDEGVIDEIDDIWILRIDELWDFIQGKTSKQELKLKLRRNRIYYLAYRNFVPDSEIGEVTQRKVVNSDLIGVGVSFGTVTGPARIINSEEDLVKIQKGDILVSRYTDTGWVTKYPLLSGLVTEYGGMLCHIATISREMRLPTIVACNGATKKIKDGQIITIDGSTGSIKIER